MKEMEAKKKIASLSKYLESVKNKLSLPLRRRGGTDAFLKRELALTETRISDLKFSAPTETKKS